MAMRDEFMRIVFENDGYRDTVSTYASLAKKYGVSKKTVRRDFWNFWNNEAAPQFALWGVKENDSANDIDRTIERHKVMIATQLNGRHFNEKH